MTFSRSRIAFLLGVIVLAPMAGHAQEREAQPSPSLMRGAMGLPFLSQQELRASVYELASPAFQGRLTGTAGHDLAARYGAERFRAAGLVPGGMEGSFLQPFVIEANEITGPMELRVEHDGWSEVPYRFGSDYVARGFTGSGRVENAEVVFVGYGLVDAEAGWDDYAGVDLTGKVALMFMGTPPGDANWGEKSRPRYKATLAAARGASAILLIDDPGEGALSPIVSVYHGQEGVQQEDLPQLSIRYRVANDLLRTTPHTAQSLRSHIRDTERPFSLELDTRVTLEARAEYTANRTTWNVVGWVEGSDPSVADEFVIVGAHLDHVGHQADEVFTGAQDNASGSVMVMTMAEAMAKSAIKPRRSVLFVLFAGEELFLLGSEYLAAHAPRPIENAVGMMNLDMVGTGPRLRMEGGATTPLFQQFAVDADRRYGGFGLAGSEPTPAVPGASDHTAFINAGVPTIYFHSAGAQGRAHTASDVPGTIDYDAYYRTSLVLYLTLFQMADRD
jgi:Peptidase family M28